jgi:hypothetical protein
LIDTKVIFLSAKNYKISRHLLTKFQLFVAANFPALVNIVLDPQCGFHTPQKSVGVTGSPVLFGSFTEYIRKWICLPNIFGAVTKITQHSDFE